MYIHIYLYNITFRSKNLVSENLDYQELRSKKFNNFKIKVLKQKTKLF